MRIPKTVMGLGGPITVEIVTKLRKISGKEVVGQWELETRTISLVKRAKKLMERTYYHELIHAAIDDSGVGNLLTPDSEETLCDLFAMARSREGDLT